MDHRTDHACGRRNVKFESLEQSVFTVRSIFPILSLISGNDFRIQLWVKTNYMNQNIYLSLTDIELNKLKTLLENSPAHDLNEILKLPPGKENQEEYIHFYVYKSLSDISGFKTSDFNDNSDLKSDLGLSLYHKRALKNYFQKIVEDLDSSKIILVKECENLVKVSDCIKLVKSRI